MFDRFGPSYYVCRVAHRQVHVSMSEPFLDATEGGCPSELRTDSEKLLKLYLNRR
jgi:hypothetical protein